jgi:hypothetical protein
MGPVQADASLVARDRGSARRPGKVTRNPARTRPNSPCSRPGRSPLATKFLSCECGASGLTRTLYEVRRTAQGVRFGWRINRSRQDSAPTSWPVRGLDDCHGFYGCRLSVSDACGLRVGPFRLSGPDFCRMRCGCLLRRGPHRRLKSNPLPSAPPTPIGRNGPR